jgi:hypothetical protein
MRWVAVVLAFALSGTAHAQVASDEIGIERFRLSIDRSGVLDVESASVPLHKSWSASVFAGFAHDPLVLYDDEMVPIEALVDRRLTTGLVGSIALWNRVQIGAGIDLVGYQHGSEDSPTMKSLPKAGLGDARLVAKLLLARVGSVHVALVPTLTVPAGSARGYLREDGVTFAPALSVSAVRDRLRVAANVGYRMKKRVDVAGLLSDDEAFARLGVGVALPVAELWWSTSFASPVTDRSSNRIAIEMLAGAARDVTANVGVFLAGGVGLQNGFGTPDWRALVGMRITYETQAPKPIVIAPVVTPQVPGGEPPVVAKPVAKLVVRIVDSEKRTISRASLATPDQTWTANEGVVALEYAGGPLTLEASAPDYQAGSVTVNIAAGAAGEAEVVLVRAVRQGQLRGQVLSFAGKPLAATITVGGKSIATDADGQYAIDLPAGSFEVTIQSAGHTSQKRTVNVKLDGVTVLNVDLRGVK